MPKKQIQSGDKVSLTLTTTQRKTVLEELTCLDTNFEHIIQATPSYKPVVMMLDEWEDFAGYIAAEANHCDDAKKQEKLDAIFEKIQHLLDSYAVEEPPTTLKFEDARKVKAISEQAVKMSEWAAQALLTATQHRIKTKALEHFWLSPAQRDVLLLVPGLSKTIKNKLVTDKSSFTVAEVASMTMTLEEYLAGRR